MAKSTTSRTTRKRPKTTNGLIAAPVQTRFAKFFYAMNGFNCEIKKGPTSDGECRTLSHVGGVMGGRKD